MVFGVAVCLTGRRVSLSSDDGGGHGGHGGGDGMKVVIVGVIILVLFGLGGMVLI